MTGKCAIVTGASSGIGYAAALKFVREGANVVAVGRNEKALSRLRDDCSGLSGKVRLQLADLREDSQIERVTVETLEAYKAIDVLVNSAGIIGNGTILDTPLEDYDRMMEINVRSVFRLMQLCAPNLVASKGAIVNVSSIAGKRAFPNVLAYCVSKAAVDQLTRCAALELGPQGVRVNAVNPGVVVTNLHTRSGMDAEQYEAFLEHSKTTHPLGRVGQPDEVAELIYFLASGSSSWITGGTFEIDGGRGQTCAR